MRENNTARRRAWLLPLVFLAGYIAAWGSIAVDRQMLVAEQRVLMDEIKSTKQQLQLYDQMQDFGDDWREIIIWNKEAVQPPEEEKNGKVGK